jgi:hypothetical protein
MSDWLEIPYDNAAVGDVTLGTLQFQTFLLLDRDLAMQDLTSRVRSLSPRQLDAFEIEYLSLSLGLIDRQQRIRSMELYAWLKIVESARYGEFPGFCTPADPIATP